MKDQASAESDDECDDGNSDGEIRVVMCGDKVGIYGCDNDAGIHSESMCVGAWGVMCL